MQLRAHSGVLPATVTPGPEATADVELQAPARGVAAGQAVVFYDGDRVLGGGRIVSTR